MSPFNEQSLESTLLELFQREGYVHTQGEEVHKRTDDVLLRDDLAAFLRDRYKEQRITEREIEEAISTLTRDAGDTLYEENRRVYRLMTEGFSLEREDTALPPLYVRPIDFGAQGAQTNRFRIVNQLPIQGYELRRPDAIVYVNGLPLVVIELKSAVKENATISKAHTQLTVRYRRDIPALFRYNAFVVISDGVNSRYGSLFAPYDFFFAWRRAKADGEETDGIGSLRAMVSGLFRKDRLLSVAHDFVFFPDTAADERKVVCRYPQYFATRKLYAHIVEHSRLREGGDGKGGTYFGATGCGKSITMLFLTRMLMRSPDFANPTILLITDRTDLDSQLAKLFGTAKQFIGDDCVVEVQSRDHLRMMLADRQHGGVFLTTIQKFTESAGLLSRRANIVCISDEAHRSQTNLSQQVRQTERGVRRNYGFAHYLRKSLPNATYVGFTGTPVDATIRVFGEVVDAYTMTQSVADGITRRIVYEGRAARVLLDNRKLQEIEDYYRLCAEQGTNEYQIEESKKAMTKMEQILGDPGRLRAVAEDFVAHYEKRVEERATVAGKAMFVCANRHIAYSLYREIAALRPSWTAQPEAREAESGLPMAADPLPGYGRQLPIEKMKLVMTRNMDDGKELYSLLGTDDDRRAWAEEYKNPKSKFQIAIVVDMWTTGFDVECLDTMYVDKPLQQHTLVQTISRVNRVYPGKEKGLVVDYIGISSQLGIALKRYAQDDAGTEAVENVEQSVAMVKDELDLLRRMFGSFDRSKFTTGKPIEQLDCLREGAELMQQTKECENRFMGHVRKLKAAHNLCSHSEELTDGDVEDIHFFGGVRAIIHKLTKGDTPDTSQMNRKVSRMVEEAIRTVGVEETLLAEADNGQLDLLGEQYMERLAKLKLPNTKVKLMERLLRTAITEYKKVNKMQGVDFTRRLNNLVERYNSRKESAAFVDKVVSEVADQMVELLKALNKEKQSFREMGISYEEKAFYDILKTTAHNFSFDYPEDKLLVLAKEIKRLVEDKSRYTDWAKRDDIRAELKMSLVVILDRHNYPPVTNESVFKEVLEQAENFKKYND